MEIRYTEEHEWVAVEGNLATVGITDHAQNALGDLVFVQLPEIGATLSKGAAAAVVESVKAASDVLAPLSGTIVEINPATITDPALVNSEPMGAGWLFKINFTNASELSDLLDENAYRQIAT